MYDTAKYKKLFIWTFAQKDVFQNLKQFIVKDPTLDHPEFYFLDLFFYWRQQTAIVTVLTQMKDGAYYLVDYESRHLNTAECTVPLKIKNY